MEETELLLVVAAGLDELPLLAALLPLLLLPLLLLALAAARLAATAAAATAAGPGGTAPLRPVGLGLGLSVEVTPADGVLNED